MLNIVYTNYIQSEKERREGRRERKKTGKRKGGRQNMFSREAACTNKTDVTVALALPGVKRQHQTDKPRPASRPSECPMQRRI